MDARTIHNLTGVNPEAVAVLKAAWPVVESFAASLGCSISVICGFRSQDQQDALYAQGRTKPGKRVTWTVRSKHTSGLAVDLGLFSNGRYLDESNPTLAAKIYSEIAAILRPLGFRWGGDFGDNPHFEFTLKP